MLHNSGMKIGMAVVLFFVFAGWVVCLGALGHVTNECRENTSEWKEGTGDEGILFRWSEPKNEDDEREYTCGINFSLDWWIIAFQFFMIIFGYLGVFVEFFHTKSTMGDLFAIATTLFTVFTSQYVRAGYMFSAGEHDDNTVAQGFKTAAAGGIVVCICNYIFMFMFGSEEQSEGAASAENKA
mmetsp:Transcript_12126/g.33128  ORF Transcript_12126/g.33128 Transcript_12126/m.33128 type:complete len:183 (+) Transcript_12126:118-666(+)